MTNQEMNSIGQAFSGTFSHACIVASDIEKTMVAYQTLLQAERPRLKQTGAPEDAHVMYMGKPSLTRAYQTFFTLGDLRIEILQPDEHPSTWKDYVDKNGTCFHHLGYNVPDMDAAVKQLEAMGATVIQTAYYNGGKYTYMDTEKLFGVILELLMATA